MKYNRYPKRDAVKHYFPLPNEIFCLDLSAGEIAVYAYLMYCEDRKTFQCHPSYKTIGSAVGLSKNTVKKYIDGLVRQKKRGQCEVKLAEMIAEKKAEIAEEKAKRKEGAE